MKPPELMHYIAFSVFKLVQLHLLPIGVFPEYSYVATVNVPVFMQCNLSIDS